MNRYLIYAYEENYGGLHGINTYAIEAELDINGLEMTARDLSQEVIEDYLYDEYWSEALYELGYTDDDEDEDELSLEIEEEAHKIYSELSQERAAWEIYKIPKSLEDKTNDELYDLISELGIELFVEKYHLKNI